jgi:hypothetical protein
MAARGTLLYPELVLYRLGATVRGDHGTRPPTDFSLGAAGYRAGVLQPIPGTEQGDARSRTLDGSGMTIPSSIVAAELELNSLAMAASDQR